MMENRAILIVLLSACALSNTTHALEYTLDLVAALEHSSNARHNATNEISEFEQRAGVALTAVENLSSLNFDAQYAANAINYSQGTATDQTVVFGQSSLLWTPLPGRFSWFLTHSIEDSLSDARLDDIPDNRESRNIITTGPQLSLRLTPVDSLSTTLTYTAIRLGASGENDSDRISGELSWDHRFNARHSLGPGVRYTDVKFDDEVNDLKNSAAFLTFTSLLRNGQYSVQVGGNRVEPSTGDDVDGPFLRFDYENILNGNPLSIIALKQLTDTSLGSGRDAQVGIDSQASDTDFDLPGVLELTRLTTNYTVLQFCQDCEVIANFSYTILDYEDDQRDQDNVGFNTRIRFPLTRRWGAIGAVAYLHAEFDDIDDREDDDSEFSLGVDYRFSQRFVISFLATHERRDSNIEAREFEDNRALLSVIYPLR